MIIDSHCHIDFDVFDNDRQQVIQRANNAGVKKIIVPGVIQSSWHKIKSCCETYSGLYPCYGLHPYFIKKHKPQYLDALKILIEKSNPVAVGECGLDFFLKDLNTQTQIFYFEQQLNIALEFNLPVVIHARKSTEAVIQAIKKRPGLRGMIHSYSGSYEQAVQLINLGFYLSFGGPLTYENASRLRKLVSQLPTESILVETDAPDQPVANAGGKRNEPAFITDVISHIAELKKLTSENISRITTVNASELFKL